MLQNNVFTGKVAIVTGSESGIGKATAHELCAAGAYVVLNGRSAERLAQTHQEFVASGYRVTTCLADITDYQACEQLVAVAIHVFGKIDFLITNASISMKAYFKDMNAAVFKQVFDSNLYGSVFPLKAALPHLIASKGCVTFISSISALNGMPSASAYCAGKAALTNLAHTLRLELDGTGVHIGVIHLGFTQNDADKRVLDASGIPVPIAHRPTGWQKTQQAVAQTILGHIKKRRKRTVMSFFGKIIIIFHTYFPTIGDWVILNSLRKWKHLYE